MTQSVQAVVTDIWKEKLARLFAGDTSLGTFSEPTYFKIGEGGWIDPGTGAEPLDPDPALTDITAGTGDYTDPSDYFFQKSLVGADLVYVAPNRLEVRCAVDTGEANDDGHGNPPEFFELGVFDADDNMLAYSTFPVEIKTASKSLLHIIHVDF